VSTDVFAGLGNDTVDASDLDGFDAVTLEVTDPDAKEDSEDGGQSDGSGIEWAIGRLNEIADRLGGRVGDQLHRVIERLQGKLDS